MKRWTTSDPGIADLDVVDEQAAMSTRLAEHADDMRSLLARHGNEMSNAWTGDAAKAWNLQSVETSIAWSRLHVWSQNTSEALAHYSDKVASIRRRVEREKALEDLEAIGAALTGTVWSPRQESTTTPDADPQVIARRAVLAEERRAADATFVAALAHVRTASSSVSSAFLVANMKAPTDTLSSQDVLDALGTLPAEDIDQLVRAHPELANQIWNDPPDSNRVADWWKSLTDEQKVQIEAAAPSIVGNLNGVPYDDRLAVNAEQLRLAAGRSDLTTEQRKTVKGVEKALATNPGEASRGLLDFNLDNHPPLAAVVIGNITTAKTVTWMVPGMGTGAAGMNGWVTPSRNLYREQSKLSDDSHAVVAWICYETPSLDATINDPASRHSVLMNTLAREGSSRLAHELDGVFATRPHDVPRVSVVSHSFGTTLTAYALTRTRHQIDSVTFVGSAGIDSNSVPNAEALHVATRKGKVQAFSTQAKGDYVATIGRMVWPGLINGLINAQSLGAGREIPFNHRVNPDSHFGAIVYPSEGGQQQGETFAKTEGHDAIGGQGGFMAAPREHGYFDSGTQSLRNAAVSSTGLGQLITSTSHDGG